PEEIARCRGPQGRAAAQNQPAGNLQKRCCTNISALKIGDDFVGDSAVNVLCLGHVRFSLWFWLQQLLQPCPSARSGCASCKENLREWCGRSRRRATVALIVLVARRGAGP